MRKKDEKDKAKPRNRFDWVYYTDTAEEMRQLLAEDSTIQGLKKRDHGILHEIGEVIGRDRDTHGFIEQFNPGALEPFDAFDKRQAEILEVILSDPNFKKILAEDLDKHHKSSKKIKVARFPAPHIGNTLEEAGLERLKVFLKSDVVCKAIDDGVFDYEIRDALINRNFNLADQQKRIQLLAESPSIMAALPRIKEQFVTAREENRIYAQGGAEIMLLAWAVDYMETRAKAIATDERVPSEKVVPRPGKKLIEKGQDQSRV